MVIDWGTFFNQLCWKMSEIRLGGEDFYMIIEQLEPKSSSNALDPSIQLKMTMKLWPKDNFPREQAEMKMLEDKQKHLAPAEMRAIEDKHRPKDAKPQEDDILDVEVA